MSDERTIIDGIETHISRGYYKGLREDVAWLIAALREKDRRIAELTAAAELCADDVCWFVRKGRVFVGSDDDSDQPVALAVNCNDYFAPAADYEEISPADAVELNALHKAAPDAKAKAHAAMGFVAKRRGVPNKRWR